MRKAYIGKDVIESIYLGGGTPSLLSQADLIRIFDALDKHFTLGKDPEITLEVNPDDINKSFVKQLQATPVNRLSIGVQSFRDDDLVYLNRIHSAKQAENSIRLIQDCGFPNLNIDLIFGIPTLSDDDWAFNLDTFFSLEIPHLSAYALTIEPKTALDVFIKKGEMKGVEEAKMATQFTKLIQTMRNNHYSHYEISNFCMGQQYALHNTNYWLGGNYLGLGPSAHSYNGESRQWNTANLKKYISGIENKVPVIEKEVLAVQQKYNEYVMVSLRTIWGADKVIIENKFGIKYKNYFLDGIRKFIARDLVFIKGSSFVLTGKGQLHADGIAAELFWPVKIK